MPNMTALESRMIKAAINSTKHRKDTKVAVTYVIKNEFEGFYRGFADALRHATDEETVIFRKVPKALAPRIEAAISAILETK